MSADLQHIIQSKEAERRRLRALPWLQKLDLLDKLRARQVWLREMRAAGGKKTA
ncbi:MAG: hypothetical protein ACR2OZ_21345 [Verrucomicrobiales bacterium]